MQYQILPIEEMHIEGFRQALDEVARERAYLAFLEAPAIDKTRTYVFEQIEKKAPHFVAIVNGSVVGWCDISPLDRPVYAHTGVLGMGVIAEYRGHGIGKALLQVALEKAKTQELTRIELDVQEENHRAIELYKRFGFKIEGLKQNATRIDGIYSNDYIMALIF
ncbi:MAG: GNAT family N-acetyltransferase [Pseudomonadota bacterium]